MDTLGREKAKRSKKHSVSPTALHDHSFQCVSHPEEVSVAYLTGKPWYTKQVPEEI